MYNARLENTHAFQWPPPDVTLWDLQLNKFEQARTDHHEMSLARGAGPRSDVWGYLPVEHVMLPTHPPPRQTDACENVTFPQHRIQAVKIRSL